MLPGMNDLQLDRFELGSFNNCRLINVGCNESEFDKDGKGGLGSSVVTMIVTVIALLVLSFVPATSPFAILLASPDLNSPALFAEAAAASANSLWQPQSINIPRIHLTVVGWGKHNAIGQAT